MPYKDPEKRREMDKIYQKRYFTSDKGRATRRRLNKRYYAEKRPFTMARPHARTTAYRAVQREIEAGRMKKEPCCICSYREAQAHHYNGYEGAAALEIAWLCKWHHAEAHRRMGTPQIPVSMREAA